MTQEPDTDALVKGFSDTRGLTREGAIRRLQVVCDIAQSQAAEIAALREANDDAAATLAAVRATSAGNDWANSAVHLHEICGRTLLNIARTRAALSPKETDR